MLAPRTSPGGVDGPRYVLSPPYILTTGPPKMGASGQDPCHIASEHPRMCKIFKFLPAAG